VLPLDGRAQARYFDPKPEFEAPRTRYTYFAGSGPVPNGAAVNVKNRSHSVAAEVEIPETGAEGVLITHGWRFGGWTFFVKDGRLHFVHNYTGREEFRVSSDRPIPTGRHFLSFEFEQTIEPEIKRGRGGGGIVRLYVNRDVIGEGQIPTTMPTLYGWGATLGCGEQHGSATASYYHAPFHFTGTIYRVMVDVSGEPFRDLEAESVAALARQ